METQHAVQRIIEDIRNDDMNIQVTGYVKEILKDVKYVPVDHHNEDTL